MTMTPASRLEEILVASDNLTVSKQGDLMVEGCSVRDLADEFGTPLYVYSEGTFRSNIRRARAAFEAYWPAPVNVMFAIKSLTDYAIRAVANEERCGGDCFGTGELEATFRGGADPERIVLNGSCKKDDDIRHAIEYGVCINMDSEQEVDQVQRIAADLDKTARLAIRVKPSALTYFDTFVSDHFPSAKASYTEELKSWKWGIGEAGIKRMIERMRDVPNLEMVGYHCHIGRSGRQVEYYEAWNRAYAKLVAGIFEDTGFAPEFVDLGGGWARERDPECGSLERNPHTIEDYAAAVGGAMREEFEAAGMPIPEMWLEMGRYLIGNAGVLLTTIDLIKRDPEAGRSWTHVDAHTLLAVCIEFLHTANHITVATGMHRPSTERTNIVGPHCITGNWLEDAEVPDVEPGDLVAMLDMGMYAEQLAMHFNSMPKPAAVLVHDGKPDLIRRRETIEDVFATQVLPERLQQQSKASAA